MVARIKSKWEEVVLSDIVEKVIDNRGKTPPYNRESGIRLIESWQVKNNSLYPLSSATRQKYVDEECYNTWFRDQHPQQDDILFTMVGASIPQYCLVPSKEKICIAQNLVGIRGKKDIVDQEFLHFYFINDFFIQRVKGWIVTTVQPSIKLSNFLNLKLRIPSLPKQREIASHLSVICEKIELLKRQNITLEQLVQQSFSNWLNKNAKKLKEIKLNSIFSFIAGDRVHSSEYSTTPGEGMIRFIRIADMDSLHPVTFIRAEVSKLRCNKGDVLVSFDGTVGKVSFGVSGAYATAIRKVVAIDERYNGLAFKYALFTHPEILHTIKSYAGGTVILHAFPVIEKLSFRLPPPDEIDKFSKKLDALCIRIIANKRQALTLGDILDVGLKNVFPIK